MKIVFSGASDDLIEVSIGNKHKEFNVIEDFTLVATFLVGGATKVYALYDGCWTFAAGMVDEGTSLPDWHIETRNSELNGYTTELHMEAPEKTTVHLIKD
jgi:hypothetical protein